MAVRALAHGAGHACGAGQASGALLAVGAMLCAVAHGARPVASWLDGGPAGAERNLRHLAGPLVRLLLSRQYGAGEPRLVSAAVSVFWGEWTNSLCEAARRSSLESGSWCLLLNFLCFSRARYSMQAWQQRQACWPARPAAICWPHPRRVTLPWTAWASPVSKPALISRQAISPLAGAILGVVGVGHDRPVLFPCPSPCSYA
jgi:hypothetical protein